jgi:hypothetical protein
MNAILLETVLCIYGFNAPEYQHDGSRTLVGQNCEERCCVSNKLVECGLGIRGMLYTDAFMYVDNIKNYRTTNSESVICSIQEVKILHKRCVDCFQRIPSC